MTPADWTLLALQFGIITLCALGLGQLCRRIGQPSVAGELAGGLLLGPTILGRISPEAFQWFLPPEGAVADARNAILRTGMLFFIFTIGVDISIKQALAVRKEALAIGVAGTLTPLFLGFGLALGLPMIVQAPPGQEIALAGFLGAILALSANPIIARILIDLDLYRHRVGVLIMSSTLVDDLVGWGLFAVLLAQFAPGSKGGSPLFTVGLVFLCVILVFCVGRYLMPRLVRIVGAWENGTMATIMLLVSFTLLGAAASEAVGVHSFLGAFLAGLSMSDSLPDFEEAYQAIAKFSIAAFTPAFFLCMGISADFIVGFDVALVLLITFIAFFGKIAGVYVGGRLAGVPKREALAVGAGLNARGILGLVMASSAYESKLIDQRFFVACVVMCLATTIFAGPALQLIVKGKLFPAPSPHS